MSDWKAGQEVMLSGPGEDRLGWRLKWSSPGEEEAVR